jgi:hypothetical protein
MADTGYHHDPMPDKTYLEERLKWDGEQLVWVIRPLWQFGNRRTWKSFNNNHAGKPAGHMMTNRKVPLIMIDGVLYRQDQIVYILHHNKCPAKIRYKDGDPTNVHPENLEPDPEYATLFGVQPYIDVVNIPMSFIREKRGEKRRTAAFHSEDGVSPRRAESLKKDLVHIKGNLQSYPGAEYLHECMEYNPETGDLIWKRRPREHFRTEKGYKVFNSRNAGKPAGLAPPNQQRWIGMDRVMYKADVLIFLLMGKEPPLWVVHRNADASDIRWANLLGVYEEDL